MNIHTMDCAVIDCAVIFYRAVEASSLVMNYILLHGCVYQVGGEAYHRQCTQ